MSVLEVKSITKTIKHTNIYSDISLNVRKGDCYALIGADNEGKTSVINAIMGFDKPDKGNITIFGEVSSNLKNIRSRIGYVPDDLLCFNNMTGAALLDMTLQLRREDYSLEFVEALIEYFQVNPALQLQEMDDDMNKCIYIINAFITKPELVILDEPFNFLSDDSIRKLKKFIHAYTDTGNTIIVVHDDYNGVADICTRFSVIKDHKQLRENDTPEMYEDLKIIVAYGIRDKSNLKHMLKCAARDNYTLKVIKHDSAQTAMLFKGDNYKLNKLLNIMLCENYEIRNIPVQAQVMEWYD